MLIEMDAAEKHGCVVGGVYSGVLVVYQRYTAMRGLCISRLLGL